MAALRVPPAQHRRDVGEEVGGQLAAGEARRPESAPGGSSAAVALTSPSIQACRIATVSSVVSPPVSCTASAHLRVVAVGVDPRAEARAGVGVERRRAPTRVELVVPFDVQHDPAHRVSTSTKSATNRAASTSVITLVGEAGS